MQQIEKNSPLVNISLLECLQGNKKSDELDLFIPFLADILEELNTETIDKSELQNAFNDRFKIVTPLGALNSLLIRAKNLGLLSKDNKQFFVQFSKVHELTNESKLKKNEIKSSINSVVECLITYAKEEFGEELTYEFGEESLYNFIRANISIFTENIDGSNPETNTKIKNKQYLLASFIKYIHQQKKSLIPDITRIVKGTLLANYLTFADKNSQKTKFNNITIYLDTPIIIGLLGWDGPTRKKSLHEFLELIIDLKANIKIFDVTASEIRGVFSFWFETLQNKRYHLLHEMTRQLFNSRGVTPEQINTESILLESNLNEIGIEVDYDFVLKEQFCCDENKLKKFLKRVGFKRTSHDITCVSRVFNSREGKSISSLNEKFSTFITPNKSIENVTNHFFKKEIEKNSIQVVASEKWLATLLWLKHPEHFTSLPFDLLLTDAYTALSSDDKFWDSFLKRFNDLKNKGNITEDDFNLVRWSSSLFNMVQHASVLSGDDIAEDDIYAIVEEIKSKQLAEKNAEIAVKTNELGSVKTEFNHTSNKIKKAINIFTQSISAMIAITYAWLWTVGMYYFGPSINALVKQDINNGLVETSGYLGFFVLLILAVIGALTGGLYIYNKIHNSLSSRITKQFFLND
ncbi:hypothetical protein [Shewanella frigidimarina]|uniref:hypothetical protein n=1 Tax=Shewanella frigidimarina TaxID=56812 RepID=UPI000F50EEA0|nr:hypothetical protein [Shewanella frigidimarina]RPA23506.1 hypothetical protein EGC78_19430 [Shewanella frigidimarina]